MRQKNARDLVPGDVIHVAPGKTFTIKEIKPSALGGYAIPIIQGTYSDGTEAEIDFSRSRHLVDHIFDVE